MSDVLGGEKFARVATLPPPLRSAPRPSFSHARARGLPVAVLDSGSASLSRARAASVPRWVDSVEVRVSGRVIAELDGFFSDGARLVAGAVGDDGLLKVREAAVSAHVEKALAAEKPTPVLQKGRGPFKRDARRRPGVADAWRDGSSSTS